MAVDTSEAWRQVLPPGQVTLRSTQDPVSGMDASAHKQTRCGVRVPAAPNFFSNFRKMHAAFTEVRREEARRGRTYSFVVSLRADLWLSQPLPSLASGRLPTGAVSLPFCLPLPAKRASNASACGPRGGGDALGRGRSACDVATDWMAIVPRRHAPAYFSAHVHLHRNGSCELLHAAQRSLCHCHGNALAPECVLSHHLHARRVPYQRVALGLLAAARSVHVRAGQPARPLVSSNNVIDANGINVLRCHAASATHTTSSYSPCPRACEMSWSRDVRRNASHLRYVANCSSTEPPARAGAQSVFSTSR